MAALLKEFITNLSKLARWTTMVSNLVKVSECKNRKNDAYLVEIMYLYNIQSKSALHPKVKQIGFEHRMHRNSSYVFFSIVVR